MSDTSSYAVRKGLAAELKRLWRYGLVLSGSRTTAEDLGYKVLVAEGSPIVLKIIVSGYVDAIVGVACLNVLEKAIDKILLAGIPCAGSVRTAPTAWGRSTSMPTATSAASFSI